MQKICRSQLRESVAGNLRSADTKIQLDSNLRGFAEDLIAKIPSRIEPELIQYETEVVLDYLSTATIEQLKIWLPILCRSRFGVSKFARKESRLQIASGALFFAAYLVSLGVSKQLAIPLFTISALFGGIGYGSKIWHKIQRNRALSALYPHLSSQRKQQNLGVIAEIGIGILYVTIVLRANRFIQPVRFLGKNGYRSVRGFKLLIPAFETNLGLMGFYTYFLSRVFTTGQKINSLNGSFLDQSEFWTDVLVNYFLALLAGNYGDLIGDGLQKMVNQIFFNSAAFVLIDNWSTHLQQLAGFKARDRYRDVSLKWVFSLSLIDKLIMAPVLNQFGKIPMPWLRDGSVQLVKLLHDIPKNSAVSAASTRYIYQDLSFRQAWQRFQLRDLLPWRQVAQEDALSIDEVLSMLSEKVD